MFIPFGLLPISTTSAPSSLRIFPAQNDAAPFAASKTIFLLLRDKFLGKQDLIVGKSHECDYPRNLEKIVKLTSPKS